MTKSLLITGASGVIGSAVASYLHAEGYEIHLAARTKEKLKSLQEKLELPQKNLYEGDLSGVDTGKKIIRDFFERASNPYAFISNAGNLGEPGNLNQIDFNLWQQSFNSNFFTPVAMIQEFARMFESKNKTDGRIILFSGAGVGGSKSFSGVSSYAIAKGALTLLSEFLSKELEKFKITINAVAPGAVVSAMTHQALKAGTEKIGEYAADAQKILTSGGVSPNLVSELISILLAPAASKLNGRLLSARFDRDILKSNMMKVSESSDLFRLRRIDNELFFEKQEKK